VDQEERKIGLSRKRVEWGEEEPAAESKPAAPTSPQRTPASELRGGVGNPSCPPIQPLSSHSAQSDSSEKPEGA
jgi:small subunit ribosomal protein S1